MPKAKTKVRKIETYTITDEKTDREFEVEHEPLDWMDMEVRILPDGRAVVGYAENDDEPCSPRECDNFGTMVCWHSRHRLGDAHAHKDVEDLWREIIGYEAFEAIEEKYAAEYNKWNEDHPQESYSSKVFQEYLRDNNRRERAEVMAAVEKRAILLPLFLYDHSGITMSTSRSGQYADQWDSSAVGYIYVTHEDALKNWSCKSLDDPVDYHDGTIKPCRERALDLLEGEVEDYDKYIQNENYIVHVHVYDANGMRLEDEEPEHECCLGTKYAEATTANLVEQTVKALTKEKHDGDVQAG